MPEAALVLIIIIVFASPIVIALFIDGRFKRSRGDRLTRLGLVNELQADNERSIIPFSSPEALGKWTKGLLVATLILAVVAVISGVLQSELLSRLIRGYGNNWATPAGAGSMPTLEEVTQAASRQQIIGILQVLLWIGTAVAFLIWFHRMHKNLPSLGQKGLVFTPGWAVGFFFVPFLNLVRPFQAMRELWHGSDPGPLELDVSSDEVGTRDRLRTPPLVGWWWALFLIANIVGNIAGRLLLLNQTIPELQAGTVLMIVSDLLEIPSALVAILLVGRLTRWQAQRAESIRQRGGLSAAASAAALTSTGQRKNKKMLYALVGLIGFGIIVMIAFAFIVMAYLSQTGGPGGDGPDQPSYGTQDPSSLSDPPADVDHPQAFDNELMTFSYPGGWQIVETKGTAKTPGVQVQSLAGTFVRLQFDELQAGAEAGVDSWSASAQKTYEGFTETGTFDEWGDLAGAGRLLSGKSDGTLHEIRLFVAPITDADWASIFAETNRRPTLLVMEMFPVTDADEVEPGLELIRKTFRMTRSPLWAFTPEELEKIKAEAARMNPGLDARVTQHSSGVTSYGAAGQDHSRSGEMANSITRRSEHPWSIR